MNPILAIALFSLIQGHSQPNVVVIRTDDMRLDELAVMPETLQRIAAQGVTFSNSFVSVALCSPSRATFLSGQYAHNHHVYGNNGPLGGHVAFDHTNSLATWLHDAGYYTWHGGKLFNGYNGAVTPPGWDEWYTLTGLPISGSYYNYTLAENGATVTYGSAPQDYQTDVVAAKALAFLQTASTHQPWFALVDFFAPHGDPSGSAVPAPRHIGAMDGYRPTLPPSFNEADMSDKPAEFASIPSMTLADQRAAVNHIRRRREALLSVDEAVGHILDALPENTVVIFTSDNGFQLGEHRILNKNTFYEESIRVPLLVRGPGFPAGLIIDQPVANIDLAPTICELTGAIPQRTMDGLSLVPLLQGGSVSWTREILLEDFFYTFQGQLSRPRSGLRLSNRLYTRNADKDELYAFPRDSWELSSQDQNPFRTVEMLRHAADLAALESCAGSGCQ